MAKSTKAKIIVGITILLILLALGFGGILIYNKFFGGFKPIIDNKSITDYKAIKAYKKLYKDDKEKAPNKVEAKKAKSDKHTPITDIIYNIYKNNDNLAVKIVVDEEDDWWKSIKVASEFSAHLLINKELEVNFVPYEEEFYNLIKDACKDDFEKCPKEQEKKADNSIRNTELKKLFEKMLDNEKDELKKKDEDSFNKEFKNDGKYGAIVDFVKKFENEQIC